MSIDSTRITFHKSILPRIQSRNSVFGPLGGYILEIWNRYTVHTHHKHNSSAIDSTHSMHCHPSNAAFLFKIQKFAKSQFEMPIFVFSIFFRGFLSYLILFILHYIYHYSCTQIKTQLGLDMISGQITHPLEKLFK